jgi:endonuclease VIII
LFEPKRMPEGPEIRRAADALEAIIVDRPLSRVWFKFDALKKHADQLGKSRVRAFETRGKAMLTHFDNELTIYSHNQLYGLWHASADGSELAGKRDLRLAIQSKNAAVYLYSASDISVWKTSAVDQHPFLAKLGPDILSKSIGAIDIQSRMQLPAFVGKNFATLLLDQGFLAGMGNYLRTEVLYYAGIHPSARPKDLSPAQQAHLAQTLLDVVQRSYRSGGVTNEAAFSGKLDTRGLAFEGYRFAAFERDGKRCLHCDACIQRAELAGRRLYWCEGCQPNPLAQ